MVFSLRSRGVVAQVEHAARACLPVRAAYGIVYETFSCPNDSNPGPSWSGSSQDHLTPFVEPRVQILRANRRAFYMRYGRLVALASPSEELDRIASVVGFLPVDDPRLIISSSAHRPGYCLSRHHRSLAGFNLSGLHHLVRTLPAGTRISFLETDYRGIA